MGWRYWDKQVPLETLIGKRIKELTGLKVGSEAVHIKTECGQEFMFYHEQDCCEHVNLNDFDGTAEDLIGSIILSAEEVEGEADAPDEYCESYTWTFYKIETDKGGLWMRWLGESNGYYSEHVDFVWVNKPEETGEDK